MRVLVLLVVTALSLLQAGGSAMKTSAFVSFEKNQPVDFERQVKPILQSKCMPCHFSGGKVYERLPFDKPETIRKLGTKLFTRIKDENDRRLITEFLEQGK
ncbi:MAG: hypothetical protein C5B55_13330 [Blastocatellia bacterium]|nr:MAG: hypothetical protein C5B55_13330 [Blastocatellia bacterium]